MHFDQIKSLQIALLTILCLYTEGAAEPLSFALLIPLTIFTRDYFYVNTVISVLISIIAYMTCMKEWMLPLVLINGLLCYCLKGRSREGENTGVKPIFLICLGLTSMNQLESLEILQLSVFFIMLIVQYLEVERVFMIMIKIYRGLLPLAVLWLAGGPLLFETSPQESHASSLHNQSWWYYLAFTLGTFSASLLSEGGRVANLDEYFNPARGIQMKEMSPSRLREEEGQPPLQGQRNEIRSQGLMKEVKESAQKSQERQKSIQEKIQIQVHETEYKSREESEISTPQFRHSGYKPNLYAMELPSDGMKSQHTSSYSKISEKEQGESLNLLLLIPFCIVDQSLLQLPLYLYLLALQWNRPHKIISVCMLVSTGLVTFIAGLDTGQSIVARVLAALLVSKQLQGGQILGEMLRSFWLRASFAVVLALLFWFSLLTVNIFHLLFIIVVLLFVIRNERVDRHSYRHQNWKYLQLLFNIFLVLRLAYALALDYEYNLSSLGGLLQITGISFSYTPTLHFFNLIPLLINAAIGLQYLTYNSAIYATQQKQPFFKVYKGFFQRFGTLLTIIYYKLIPWVSYVVVLGILVAQDFSLSSLVLLGWGIMTIGVHVLSKHDLASYRRMNLLWLGFMRLISLQIVLRFAFQFAKFDLLSFLKGLPFFDTLLKYQQLLGLAIPKQDALYLKTVTKFQLMVSLDLASIFVAFLVQDYYLLLIRYLELPEDPDRQPQDQKIAETYDNYINFKIVNWLSGYSVYRVLRITCNVMVELYFPFLGVMACLWNSITMGLYLLVGLRYYLILNMAYYQSHVENNLMQKVLGAVMRWRKKILGSTGEQVLLKIEKAHRYIWTIKIKSHDKLRLWIVVITSLSILLVHLSKSLTKPDVVELFGYDLTVALRWWLYVGGCSVQLGVICHFSKLVLMLVVVERKCCWFMDRFHQIQEASPELEEDRMTVQVLNQREDIMEGGLNDLRELSQGGDQQEQQGYELNEIEGHREHEVVEMRVSLLFGCVKMLERSLVMVLVFASLVEMSHPFGVVYLLCAILLNYLGSLSIKSLSRLLFVLILAEYFLLLSNYTNKYVYHDLPEAFLPFQGQSVLNRLFHLPYQWEAYLTFGKSVRELAVMLVSWLLVVVYPIYFKVLRWAGKEVIDLLQKQIELGLIAQRLIDHIQQVYSYGLSYSPLVIMILCLWIYFLDYTVTNLFLTVLTVGFIYISFLVRDYKDSRQFWRTYFIVLQLMVVFFMLIFSLLQLPMLSKYCTKVLCATEQLHTQLYKALLLLILQLGLDLTHSHHFDRALARLAHSRVRTNLQRIAIAQRHNDRKILEQFKRIRREKEMEKTVETVVQFLKEYKSNPQSQFNCEGKDEEQRQKWLDLVLDFLPEIVDEYLLLNENETRTLVFQQNSRWMQLRDIADQELPQVNDSYIDYFADYDHQELVDELYGVLKELEYKSGAPQKDRVMVDDVEKMSARKSFMHEELPMETREVMENIRVEAGQGKQKQQLLYLLLVQSVFSNWHYLSYLVLILVHIRNLGLLTFPIPLVIFCWGLVSCERAGKQIWRLLLILVFIPLLFKFSLGTSLLECSPSLTFLLVGDNLDSNLLEYISIICIVGETVILKLMGHWQESTEEIQCMKMALIRNIVNTKHPEERGELFDMLKQSEYIPTSFADKTFGRSELKAGYDYSTVLTALQLFLLIWVFLFYDRMAVKHETTFYRMIQYNQFSSGMVVLTLMQLLFLLAERFIAISDLTEWNDRWQAGLLLKYLLLIVTLVITEAVVLLYFPLSSAKYVGNSYITILVVVSMMALLVQALQIKKGLDRASKGFMDRYTWYNGFIYMGYRAIPFLFQFKMFSDWTFTKTALRIFDWIRLEEIFGRLYVAKCNSLFLAGRKVGLKIEWWKKLLMGYPLLLSIILLLFGPLVLFSGLNPLASLNDVSAGYLEIVLRVNRTNQYPLYTNSHITDIHHLDLSHQDEEFVQSYDIQSETVQILHLEEFSDQYWEISEGSYHKLLMEPEESLYQLTVRARFDRNLTGITSLYVLASLQIDGSRVQELKRALQGKGTFCVDKLINPWMRLDNNNGLHLLGDDRVMGCLHAEEGIRASKQYWMVDGGLKLRIASDKYTQAIFGYSVMSFYISIILVIANYFRFLFQGSVHNIIFNDIPHADPLLAVTNAVFKARRSRDLQREEELFWMIIDLLRSPDTMKALTGDYLQARLDTLKEKEQ